MQLEKWQREKSNKKSEKKKQLEKKVGSDAVVPVFLDDQRAN